MIKIRHILLLAAAALLTLAGCLKDPGPAEGLRMRVAPTLAGDTKGSLTTADLTDFYLQVVAADPAYSYFEHASKDGGGAWTTPSRLYWKDETSPVSYAAARFGAYAFTADDFNDEGVLLELPVDQSTQEGLNAADLLLMPAASAKFKDTTDGTLPVTLSHGLAKVTFTLTLGPDFYDNFFTRTANPVKDFTVKGSNLGFNFKPQTGAVSVAADTKADITPLPGAFTPGTSESKNATATYEAILVPQEFAAGALKVTFRVGSFDYEWSNADAVTLVAGKTYDLAVSAIASPVGQVNGHQFVDMGGKKWAACNVGADNPWDYGDYFSWGETAPKTTYDWTTYAFGSSDDSLTKYCTDSQYGAGGFTDMLTELQLSDDAARQNWGGSWRTPTEADWTWLRENSTWTWQDDYDGTRVKGMLITSDINGNTIFLPATGYYSQDKLKFEDYGYYWSSTLSFVNYNTDADFVCFDFLGYSPTNTGSSRYHGLPVRPVAN